MCTTLSHMILNYPFLIVVTNEAHKLDGFQDEENEDIDHIRFENDENE